MSRLLCVAALVLAAAPAHAYRFIGCGWAITGYAGSCPDGYRENDGCGCTVSSAPRWYGAQLSMRVENQGGNGVTAAEFVAAGQSAARSWTDVSCSTAQIDASQTFAATNTARWGNFNNNSSAHEIFFVTGESEWIQATGSGGGGTLGVTVSPWQSFGCADREFYDSDILINGFVQWGWTATTVEETVVHEMGHSIGLDHPCLTGYLGCGTDSCVAVMAASGGDYTTPQQDDVNGICALYPGDPGGLGSSCTSPSQCDPGFSCITHQGFSYCSQSCGTCPTGYSCQSTTGGMYCVRRGVPGVGEACTAQCADGAICMAGGTGGGGICYATCNPSLNDCSGGYRCVALEGGGGACIPPGSKTQGEVCADATECAAGLICVGDQSVAYCERACNPTQPGSCGSGYMCGDLGGGDGYCLPAAGEGDDCSNSLCFDGLVCAGDGTTYLCRRACDPAAANSCGTTQSCFELSNGGGACYPRGEGQPGDSCFSVSDCASGNLCVSTQGGGGVCMLLCNPASPSCPESGQSCVPLVGSSEGVCDPPGGAACSCDTSATCQTTCSCDPDCCSCDASAACDRDCACDPHCAKPGICGCDLTYYCDLDGAQDCACDPECPCTCDEYKDQCDCDCDPDCAKEGCLGCSGSSWTPLLAAAAGLLLLGRRRRNR